ncbi:anhydro-N-acetylmuramic acid kinase [Myroides sp. JBRI-B21084]|uniref:anhydro-N-acetylmuramic acid kinase n=1 Tax=Myroides sp. JBRI-B21084 TaxID=3119977 RepID=UPI0026E2B6E2|nr:anhydro-N-acetylmuramic acid kinase [Paenimyroides cloacae]WKW47499.1 anhydro-N-acetylmuramic acid kinase [Paenimyroides cloacae]
MKAEKFTVLGVMSGTSLDGIDCAIVEFKLKQNNWQFNLIHAQTLDYTLDWKNKLSNGINLSATDLHLLNIEYTFFLGELLNDFLNDNKFKVDFISSHGHTILHQPQNGITLQIGNLPIISDLVSLPFVCDFRVQDVQLGGQGAPLVPIGDRLLFSNYDYCLNLGGFSNISYEENNQRIAFDICPVNTLLNYFAEQLGKEFDENGNFASKGKMHQPLFKALNELAIYEQKGPKSLGVEQVKSIFLPLILNYKISAYDVLATLTEHMAYQISKVITKTKANLLVTGGGAFNTYLIGRIKFYAPNINIQLESNEIIAFKEAIIFAFLGVLKVKNINNVLSSVTGAIKDHCSGVIFNEDLLQRNC